LIIPTADHNPEKITSSPQPVAQRLIAEPVDAQPAAVSAPSVRPRNYTWAELMKRVFLVDVLQCERCGGPMKILSAIHPPEVTTRILDCLGLPSRAPPLKPAVTDFDCHVDSY